MLFTLSISNNSYYFFIIRFITPIIHKIYFYRNKVEKYKIILLNTDISRFNLIWLVKGRIISVR